MSPRMRRLFALLLALALIMVTGTTTVLASTGSAGAYKITKNETNKANYRSAGGKLAEYNKKNSSIVVLDEGYTSALIGTGAKSSVIGKTRAAVPCPSGCQSIYSHYAFDLSANKAGNVGVVFSGVKFYINPDDSYYKGFSKWLKTDSKGCYLSVKIRAVATNWDKKIIMGKQKKKDGTGYYNYGFPGLLIGKTFRYGLPEIVVWNVGELTMQYTFYVDGTNTPVKVRSNTTYNDIDWGQAMTFTGWNIKTHAVTATPKKSVLYFIKQASDSYTFADNEVVGALDEKNPENAVSFEWNSTTGNIKYTTAQRTGKGTSRSPFKPAPGHPTGSWSYYGASSYSVIPTGKNSADKPYKRVSSGTAVNASKTDVTLRSREDPFTWVVYQKLPDGIASASLRPASLVFKDNVDPCVTVDEVKIYCDGADISSRWTITANKGSNGTSITATCKDPGNAEYYGSGSGTLLKMVIHGRITASASELKAHGHVSDDIATITNKASFVYDGTTKMTGEVIVRAPAEEEPEPPDDQPADDGYLFSFKKVDAEDGHAIQGAVFSITGTSDAGERIEYNWLETDADGMIYALLPAGTYTMVEVSSATGYIKSEETWTLVVTMTETVKRSAGSTTKNEMKVSDESAMIEEAEEADETVSDTAGPYDNESEIEDTSVNTEEAVSEDTPEEIVSAPEANTDQPDELGAQEKPVLQEDQVIDDSAEESASGIAISPEQSEATDRSTVTEGWEDDHEE